MRTEYVVELKDGWVHVIEASTVDSSLSRARDDQVVEQFRVLVEAVGEDP